MIKIRRKLLNISFLILSISFILIGASTKSLSNNLDGLYTLKTIESSSGELKTFSYGGILTVIDSSATLKTDNTQAIWDLANLDCTITETGFSQIDSETNDKYIFERIQ